MKIRSKAPLRISFLGGGTDVPPYCDEHGGAVLNSTVGKYAYCTITPRADDEINIQSLDYHDVEWKVDKNKFKYDGNLDLIKAVLNHFDVDCGFDMLLHCDAPPGSGLGSSSTVMVSLIGAMAKWLHVSMSPYDIANLAWKLERKELGWSGGKQDQYSATFGGFNYIDFKKGGDVVVTPLRIRRSTLDELHYNLLLCYLGKTRDGGNIIERQAREQNKEILDEVKSLADEGKDLLMKGNIREFGLLLNKNWELKKKFTKYISNEYIDKIYDVAIKNGAIGGKISGAGGGGHMYFICEFDKKHIVANQLKKLKAEIINFTFEESGIRAWTK